jgi:hypothetical protein
MLFLSANAVLIVGSQHFRNGWTSPGTHPYQAIGPGGATGFVWASTLAISAYWAHPTALLSFPPSEIAWMVLSPIAIIVAVTRAAQTVRRLDLSVPQLRFASHAARAASLALGLFVFGTLTWLVDGARDQETSSNRGPST